MPFIRVYDRNFQVVGEIDEITSLVLDRDFYGAGSFELHMAYRPDIYELINAQNYLLINNRQDRTLIVEDLQIGDQKTGTDIKVKGTPLLGCLKRRIVIPKEGENYLRFDNMAAEDIMYQFVEQQCIGARDVRRRIEHLILFPSAAEGGTVSWRATYNTTLLETLYDIGAYAGLGHYMYIDIKAKKMIYRVVAGRNLSTRQSDRPPVIFSCSFDNLVSADYEYKGSDEKNAVYAVMGDIEKNDFSVYVERDSGSRGMDLKEECISVTGDSMEDLVFEAGKRLLETSASERISAEVMDTCSFRYEKDWDLGDIVTVVHDASGKVMHERITSIREIYEHTGGQVELTFGLTTPGFRQRIEALERRVLLAGR